jgi:hypothetical protein
MTRADGQCRVDAVEVGELTYVGIGSPTAVLSCKYALSNATSGDRYGAGNRNTNWSERTLSLLQSLLDSMERDIVHDVFHEGATIGGVEDELSSTTEGVPSL